MTQRPRPRADSPARRDTPSTALPLGSGWLARTEPEWRKQHPLVLCPLTWLFPAPVPATPTGLGGSLRVARSLWRKYREILAAKRNTAVNDLLFYHSVQNGKWKTPLRVRCWPIQRSSPPKAPPTAEDRPISLRLVRDDERLNVERKEPSKNIKSLGRGKGCQIML